MQGNESSTSFAGFALALDPESRALVPVRARALERSTWEELGRRSPELVIVGRMLVAAVEISSSLLGSAEIRRAEKASLDTAKDVVGTHSDR